MNRLRGELGFCRVANRPMVSAYNPHFGEEPPISGKHGSGTVFFTSCTMSCKFCQNYPISQLRHGNEVEIEELARIFLWLQKQGCHNINLVSPDPQIPLIAAALDLAICEGLNTPVVANTGGYHSEFAVELMSEFVDVFLPDFKYFSNEVSKKLIGSKRYVDSVIRAIDMMYGVRGPLAVNGDGIADRGVLIRHMVLPNNLSGTDKVLAFIAQKWPGAPVSLMLQYFPAHEALRSRLLGRKLTVGEAVRAVELFRDLGLCGYVQRYSARPDAKGPICAKEGA